MKRIAKHLLMGVVPYYVIRMLHTKVASRGPLNLWFVTFDNWALFSVWTLLKRSGSASGVSGCSVAWTDRCNELLTQRGQLKWRDCVADRAQRRNRLAWPWLAEPVSERYIPFDLFSKPVP